jgi:hypothetical protein
MKAMLLVLPTSCPCWTHCREHPAPRLRGLLGGVPVLALLVLTTAAVLMMRLLPLQPRICLSSFDFQIII